MELVNLFKEEFKQMMETRVLESYKRVELAKMSDEEVC